MHLATQADVGMFHITVDGQTATRADVLPGWGPSDRLGVVVCEPFGALGASLLIQLAVTAFYDCREDRRGKAPQYPEIYLFHVGGRFGDHRPFDFWPPRKEVFVKDDPLALLEAVNDRAITVPVLPDTLGTAWSPTDTALDESGAPWSETNSFLERCKSAYLYRADGRLPSGTTAIRGLDDVLEANGRRAATPEISLNWLQQLGEDELHHALPGPGTLGQTLFWARTLKQRLDEVDQEQRSHVRERLLRRTNGGVPTETYQRLTPPQVLHRIWGAADSTQEKKQ